MTSREYVMRDSTAHNVLKNWLKTCEGHDPVDNINDAEILVEILQAEHDRVVDAEMNRPTARDSMPETMEELADTAE